jgi:hypothetical protein
MKKILLPIALVVLAVALFVGNSQSAKAYSNNNLIDDAVFDNAGTMSAPEIQNFLNQYPNSCLKGYTDTIPDADPYKAYFTYGGSGTAAQIIRRVADVWGINPQVILTKLEQESSLISGSLGCPQKYFISSMGYNCPDPLSINPRTTIYNGQTIKTCVEIDSNMGFARQVTKGAWQLKWDKEAATGNVNWQGNGGLVYGGNMTQGIRKRCNTCASVYFDGYATIGTTLVHMDTGATAALYKYTPHIPSSFPRIFETFFGAGSTASDRCYPTISNQISGVTFRKVVPKLDQAEYVVYSGSSTGCIESHTWNIGIASWYSHLATNIPSSPPDSANVQYADLNGDGIDEPILVGLNPTGSGKIEFHIWNKSMNSWVDHIVSPMNAGNLSNGKITFADIDGDGRDEPILVLYNNTGSSKIELHVLNNNMQSWKSHIATQVPEMNQQNGTIEFGDLDGNKVDEVVLILYRNTGSGKVEFHTWNPGWASWRFQTASNLNAIDPSNAFIKLADVDGNSIDEAVLVQLRNTRSNKIEFHTWQQGVQFWRYHTASNITSQ